MNRFILAENKNNIPSLYYIKPISFELVKIFTFEEGKYQMTEINDHPILKLTIIC